MATGSGKTTVMAMLAAWSVLNKRDHPNDKRFSDAVIVVCPNVTIRDRLRELDPAAGAASVYRTRDLVPADLMPRLAQGRVVVTNWHTFEPQGVRAGGETGRVLKAGVAVRTRETVKIGKENTTARGSRFLTLETFEQQVAAGMLAVIERKSDRAGNLESAVVDATRYVESDAAMVRRVLGREIGGKGNVLVFNDEAHHAYRIRKPEADDEGNEQNEVNDLFSDVEEAEEFFREATVWVEGLDRIHKRRGINLCVDLSATPYYLGRVGQDTNRPFPWVVSDFGLIDAIESGLVKIPQLAIRDTSGADVPGYFNVWQWIMPKLTAAERGAKKASPKPEAILKYAATPIAMLAGLWDDTREAWAASGSERPPVFIVVCKNTAIAKVVYDWLALGQGPAGVPPLGVESVRNHEGGTVHTIRVDTKVAGETDTGNARSDDVRWMRFTLDTVGRRDWPADGQGRALYPDGFEELAKKLGKAFHPPGRDVRCIVSVAMLTEGWDCNTVTHIVGLRPFQSQLLCEQVVGRGLRRASYETNADGRLGEEVAKVFGVPFDLIPVKANPQGAPPVAKPSVQVRAVPAKAQYAITFPRVERYTQAVRNRVAVNWPSVPDLVLDPHAIPPEVEVKAALPDNKGRHSLSGPGRLESVTLSPYRQGRRRQALVFDLAAALTKQYVGQPTCEVPPHALFPQLVGIVERFLADRVKPIPPAETIDVFLSPYYGWAVERLTAALRPDATAGEAPELPVYEGNRPDGTTADVSFPTRRDVREVVKSHVNFVVADTKVWEQSAAYIIDTHPGVAAFVKNAGLNFAIPYDDNGEPHDYLPDFLVRLALDRPAYLILETKGYDPLADVKADAARRWCSAVNVEGSRGHWQYAVAKDVPSVRGLIEAAAADAMRRLGAV